MGYYSTVSVAKIVARQVTTFGYDYDDQLISFSKSGTSVSYSYDALGRQLSKSVNGALTVYYFDGDQILLEKQGGVNTAQYLWGNGLVRCNGEYPLTGGRVNVRLTTNASQQVTSSNQPDAFGIGSVTAGTASAYAYGGAAGYREDGISPAGLSSSYAFQKVGARYYDPAFGAFLTRDTDLSQSPYAYCDGDPVNFSDPSGHRAKKKHPGQGNSAPPSGPGGSAGASSSGGSAGGNGGGGGAPSAEGGDAAALKPAVHNGVVAFVGGTVGLFTTAAFAPLMTPIGSGIMGLAAGADAGVLTDYYLTKAGY